ncbi:hypothetical protein LO771_07810 [Streptacidiphilus sp. ASG 303]|uniref:hypothetical protein n=1 Tax=Streptacidiphilus sp. ASG 303 TaxID=2896847 RepID=UPI001E37CAAC|nr:hypothetical protein [Streptacidiphilus sp. ASG 303]MCD0482319.1 hypothetical protein [Streptacidiphilus sp. ASG 303]
MSPAPKQEQPDEAHRWPASVDKTTVEAVGKLSEALETTERARGHLYAFHQLTGGADLALGEAVRLLREAGHEEAAGLLETEVVGRNVIPGHWTFQIIEAYNATYYRPFAAVEEKIRGELVQGREHLYEAWMKEDRRTHGHPDHTARP